MEKICAKCEQAFECLAEDIENCHCSRVTLSQSELDEIAKEYDNCLCNACLQASTLSQKE